MIDRPLISCIIIFWNAARFLGEAVESVLAQTYDRWELILVDDGSTDGSGAIAGDFAERYPQRIRYVHHPDRQNLGMSASRNLGIRHSTGEYVAFLDADDTWFPYAFKEQVAGMGRHPEAAMVYGPLSWWYSWTGSTADQDRDRVEDLGVPPEMMIEPPELLPLFLMDRAAVPSGMLTRRDVIDEVGGFEDNFRGEYEDQVFLVKVCLDFPVFASGRSWYRYRQHEQSTVSMGLATGDTHRARLAFLAWLQDYLDRRGKYDPAVRRALKHELRRLRHPGRHRALSLIGDLTQRGKVRLRGTERQD